MVTPMAPEINSALDHPDPRQAVERVKDVVQRRLLDVYPTARIVRTDFFNHTYVPDLLMTWSSGAHRPNAGSTFVLPAILDFWLRTSSCSGASSNRWWCPRPIGDRARTGATGSRCRGTSHTRARSLRARGRCRPAPHEDTDGSGIRRDRRGWPRHHGSGAKSTASCTRSAQAWRQPAKAGQNPLAWPSPRSPGTRCPTSRAVCPR
ncbi:hypothetical protein LV779_13790 [Streptomyces thinghirensis]|nr:hypothetical protein [Streptomyces thinghirensis]